MYNMLLVYDNDLNFILELLFILEESVLIEMNILLDDGKSMEKLGLMMYNLYKEVFV